MSHKTEKSSNALLELWEIVLRYRWRFIIPAFVVMTVLLSVSIFLPRKYKAVGIFERRTDMVLTEMTNRHGAANTFQNPRNSIVEQITGQPAIDQVLKQLEPRLIEEKLVHNRLDIERLREDLIRHVVVHWDISNYQLDRIRVEYVGSHPQLATYAVNAMIESYIRRAEDQMNGRLNESSKIFKAEADKSRRIIEKLEGALLNFEIKHGDLLPENPNNIQTRLIDAQERLSETSAARNAAAIRVDALTRALKNVPHTIPILIQTKNPELSRLQDKMRTSQDKLAQYLTIHKMTESHPDIIALREQIADLKKQIASTDTEVVIEKQFQINPQRQELELQLTTAFSEQQALTQQAASLEYDLNKMNTTIEGLFAVRSKHRKLSRQQDEARRQLTFWEDNLRRVDMARAAASSDRGVQMVYVKLAIASLRPVSPNLGQMLMAAIGLGLLAGGLSVFIAYRTDDTFIDSEQLAGHFNIPLFGSVSEIITRQQRRVRHFQRVILYPTNVLAMVSIVVTISIALYLDLETRPNLIQHMRNGTATNLVKDATPDPREDVD